MNADVPPIRPTNGGGELLGTQSLSESQKLAGLTVRFMGFWC